MLAADMIKQNFFFLLLIHATNDFYLTTKFAGHLLVVATYGVDRQNRLYILLIIEQDVQEYCLVLVCRDIPAIG